MLNFLYGIHLRYFLLPCEENVGKSLILWTCSILGIDVEKLVLSIMELRFVFAFSLPMCDMDMWCVHLLWAVTFRKTSFKVASCVFEVFSSVLLINMYLGPKPFGEIYFNSIVLLQKFSLFHYEKLFLNLWNYSRRNGPQGISRYRRGEHSGLHLVFNPKQISNAVFWEIMNFILQDILFCSGFQDRSGKSGNFLFIALSPFLWN